MAQKLKLLDYFNSMDTALVYAVIPRYRSLLDYFTDLLISDALLCY